MTNKYVPQRFYFQKWKHSSHCDGCAHLGLVLTCFWVCFQIYSLQGKMFCGSAKKNFLKGTIMSVKINMSHWGLQLATQQLWGLGYSPYITLACNRSLTFPLLFKSLLLRISATSFPLLDEFLQASVELPHRAVLYVPRQTLLFFSKILDLIQHESHELQTPKSRTLTF